MIKGIEHISELFSIFHDGSIIGYEYNGNDLVLKVDIEYLAERIKPEFHFFKIVIKDIEQISFSTWPNEPSKGKENILSVSEIFKPELEILEGQQFDGKIRVICDQASSDYNFCGGELIFSAKNVSVYDEDEKIYTIEELRILCIEYWDEWKKRHEKK